MADDTTDRTDDERGAAAGTLDDLMDAGAPATRPRRRWILVLLGLFAVLALLAGAVAGWGWSQLNALKRDPALLPTARPSAVTADPAARPLNFLLLGSDSRGEDQGRSDVMMLVHSDPERSKLYLISMPRDLWVPIPGHGTDKINAAYAYGGAPLAVQTVEQLLTVPIDHVALTDFEGFFRLIDDVGGVRVYNEHASASRGFTFPRGELDLTGESALVYVRERYALPRGDLDRAERQRLVVKAIIDKLASNQTLTNPARLLNVVNRLSQSVTVDGTLSNQRILTLARELNVTAGTDIEQLQVPVAGFGTSPAGASFVRPDMNAMQRLAEALASGRMADYRP